MIDFTKLNVEELLQLQKSVNDYVSGRKIPEPDFNLHNSIQVEERSYVNLDTFIPTLEFKISVNKEDLQDFKTLWENYYNKEKRLFGYHRVLPPEKKVNLDIKHAIERKFIHHLDTIFPVVHYGRMDERK
jgi:hypothetical protein